MARLSCREKVRETAHHLPSWAKQTWLGENEFNLLPIKIDFCSEKQSQIKTCSAHPLPLLPRLSFSPSFLSHLPPSPPQAAQGDEDGGCSETMADPLCCFFLLTLFPYSSVGPAHALQCRSFIYVHVHVLLLWAL